MNWESSSQKWNQKALEYTDVPRQSEVLLGMGGCSRQRLLNLENNCYRKIQSMNINIEPKETRAWCYV